MPNFSTFRKAVGSRIYDKHYRREVEEELLDHLESAVEELQIKGLSEEEARTRAIEDFGDPELIGILLQKSGKGGGPVKNAKTGALWGAALVGGGFLLVFLVLFGIVEPLRGYSLPDWQHGLNAWVFLGLSVIGLGVALGALAGVLVMYLKNRPSNKV